MRRSAFSVCIYVCLAAGFGLPAMAQNTGSVYVSEWTGATWAVNANIITDPNAAFLSGGPSTPTANGLPLGTVYYYQITDPSGKTLLSLDDITCRTVQVQPNPNNKGVLYGLPPGAPPCSHPDALSLSLPVDPNGGDPLRLMPF